MASASTSLQPFSPVVRLVPTFQFWLSMTCESMLFNWPDRVLKANELVASVLLA